MILFSIITICRNNLQELIATYNSILPQQSKSFEWIVIDGNSNDGTKEWLADNPLAKWVSEPDKGIFDAMNKGIDLAAGQYMIFMNSGDLFADNTVLHKVEEDVHNLNFPHFMYGDSIDMDESGNEFYRKGKHYSKNWIGMITQHQAMFFNRMALGDIKYSLDFPITGDYAFISEFIEQVDRYKIAYLGIPVCKFSMGGTNEIRRFKALREDYRIRKNFIKVPWVLNAVLYLLHFTHTILKKVRPSSRFMKHQQVDKEQERKNQ